MEYIRTLSKAELDRRIGLLGRAAERLPELREAILLERSRLERVLAEKRVGSAVRGEKQSRFICHQS